MILVDTSVWIDLLGGRIQPPTADQLSQFVTCGPIIQEVLQGLRVGSASDRFQERFLALPCLADPVPLSLFLEADAVYREGRRRGRTIRSSTDCLIAAIAIDNGASVWHRDRDFDAIAQYTPLRIRRDLAPRVL
jgi:predicted nucleic acid-binding protein